MEAEKMKQDIDWDHLSFTLTPADTMYHSTCAVEEQWQAGDFIPYGNLEISPAAGVLNYGQGIFEGMKALRTKQGEIVLFRPEDNAQRFAQSAVQTSMPPVPEQQFLDAVMGVVRRNVDFIPPYKKGALYLRPGLWGSGPILGIGRAPEYTFTVFASPVGLYFKEGMSPIKLKVCRDYHRASRMGMGNAKFIGNYAGTILHSRKAKAEGYAECLYLDACEDKYVEEVGAANFFCVKDGKLLTPELGSILPGITRETIMILAAEVLGLEVVERLISLEEVLQADECFCTGTAAIIAPIGSITDGDQTAEYNNFKVGPIAQKLYDLYRGIQLCELEDTYGWVTKVK